MAHRRSGRRGGAPRRKTSWVSLGSGPEDNGFNTAGNTIRDVLLYTPTVGEVSAGVASGVGNACTVVRIVGSVATALQAATVDLRGIFWGIYLGKSGGGGSFRLDPSLQTDVADEQWLHWRAQYHFLADDQMEYRDQAVDIKVMRKIPAGAELRFAIFCQQAYSSAQSLRALIMLP